MGPAVLLAYVALVVVTDIVVFLYIGRWNTANIFSPTRFVLILMVLLLQWPAWISFLYGGLDLYGSGVYNGMIACAVAPLFVVFGALMLGRPSMSWSEWWRQPFAQSATHVTLIKAMPAIILLGIVLQVYMVGSITRVPLVANILHSGNAASLRNLREQAFKLQPLYLRYPVAFSRHIFSFIPVAALVGMLVWRIRGRIWFVPVLLLGVVDAAMEGAKGPPAAVILAAFVAWLLMTGRRLRLRYILIGAVVVLAFPLFFTLARYGMGFSADEVAQAYKLLAQRIFIAPSLVVLQTFAYVPAISGAHYYGRTINLWSAITGQRVVALPNLVYVFFNAGLKTGFANAAYFADAWANFAWPGIVVFSLLVGIYLAALERILLSCNKTLLSMAVVVASVVGCRTLVSMPATSFLLSNVGLACLILAWIAKRTDVAPDPYDLAAYAADQDQDEYVADAPAY